MNNVVLIGRLTKDPQMRSSANGQMAIAGFTLAVDRPVRSGEKKQADFIRITVFGKQAETCGKYLTKGRLVAVSGSIRTGSYQDQSGNTVFTTEVAASWVEFLESGRSEDRRQGNNASSHSEPEDLLGGEDPSQIFEQVDEILPY